MEGREETPGGLGAAAIDLLHGEGVEVSLAPGEFAAREGMEGSAFFVILEGEADVVREAEGSSALPLARLGPGATFGELALLGEGRISASVVAASPLRLLEIPRERFHSALAACEPLRIHLLSRLARDLRRTSDGAVGLHRRAELLRALLTPGGESEPVVTDSAAMKRVVAEAARLARSTGPVLVTGAPGTGRSFAARLLHDRWGQGTPFLAVDARRLVPGDIERLFTGPAPVADAGTVVIRHVDGLAEADQRSLARLLSQAPPRPLRFVATSSMELEPLVASGKISPVLAETFGGRRLRLPTLRERKLDLLPLANLFLERAAGERRGRRLSIGAERELAARSFSQRNVTKLRETMELASLLAQGDEIRADELFTGSRDDPAPFLLDVTDRPGVKSLVTGRTFDVVRWVNLAFFVGVTALFLFAPRSAPGRSLNAVTWGLWEPALIASFLLVGRFWCTFCPLSALARLAQRAAGLGWTLPEVLSGRGVSLAAAGFVAIVWAERAYRMPEEPVAAGLFFTVLGVLAVGTAVVFDREVFCRRLCPLGTLGAACSLPAPFQLRSTPSVCGSLCRTHDCFRGNATEAGCPVSHHPLSVAEGYACKACFRCVKSCPHGSVRFGFRWPLEGVWRLGGSAGELVPFATTFFAISVALFAASRLELDGGVPWALLAIGALVLGLTAGWLLQRFSGEREGARLGQLVFSLLVLGWALMLSSEIANWPGAASLRIEPVGIPLLGLVQGAIVAFGLLLTAICLVRVHLAIE